MSQFAHTPRPRQGRRLASPLRLLVIASLFAIIGALVWALWVAPINASVRAAQPQPLGTSSEVTLDTGASLGVWTDSVAADLGTLTCTMTNDGGNEVGARRPPALNWDDVLWWATAQPRFAQMVAFVAPHEGNYTVSCSEKFSSYGGQFLVADNSFGEGSIGLGRSGSNDFATGTILAYCTVVCPLLAVLLLIMARISFVARAGGAERNEAGNRTDFIAR